MEMFTRRLQTIAARCSLINAILLFGLGLTFIVFPRVIAKAFTPEEQDSEESSETAWSTSTVHKNGNPSTMWLSMVATLLFRLMGSLLLALSCSCFLLLSTSYLPAQQGSQEMQGQDENGKHRIVNNNNNNDGMVFGVRIACAIQAVTGLCWVVAGFLTNQVHLSTIIKVPI